MMMPPTSSRVLPNSFLYMDPDSGLLTVMWADEDGFRPLSAQEQAQGLAWPVDVQSVEQDLLRQDAEQAAEQDAQGDAHAQDADHFGAHAINEFVCRFEHAYPGA